MSLSTIEYTTYELADFANKHLLNDKYEVFHMEYNESYILIKPELYDTIIQILNKNVDWFKLLKNNKNYEIIVDIKYKPTLLISNKIYDIPLKVTFFYEDVEYNIYNLKNVIEK